MTPNTTQSPRDTTGSDEARRNNGVIKDVVVPLFTVVLSIGGSYFVSSSTAEKEIQELTSKEKIQGQVVYDNIALQYFSSLSDFTEITTNSNGHRTS